VARNGIGRRGDAATLAADRVRSVLVLGAPAVPRATWGLPFLIIVRLSQPRRLGPHQEPVAARLW
jgi:hypothetical protein